MAGPSGTVSSPRCLPMQRDLGRLVNQAYDLLIIGGGIYGACAAWDAALRGLSVALVEQGDFGGATSANSQKIVHGGFRYLQRADLARVRASVLERTRLMRIAPHLVHPMPVLLPTYRSGLQTRAVMRAALAAYDLFSWDRNAGVCDTQKRIPGGRLVSREECLRLAPGLAADGVTGGAIWHDGQIYNSERLTLAFLRSAADRGAYAANYVRVNGFLRESHRIIGVKASDTLTGRAIEIRARLVLNAAGPWVGQVLGFAEGVRLTRRPFSKTISVVVSRPVTHGCAVSLVLPPRNNHERPARRLFITPWRGRDIIGSSHSRDEQGPEACRVSEEEIEELITDFNRAYPGRPLTAAEISFVHVGLLPLEDGETDPSQLAGRPRIVDHARTDGLEGLVSVEGVKYTTARQVAEQAVMLAMRKLGRAPGRSRSATTPLYGGAIERFEEFLAEAIRHRPYGLAEDIMRQLVHNYGSDYRSVLASITQDSALRNRLSASSSVIRAEVVHAVREEQALTLSDVVFRRTELGTAGHPGEEALRGCAGLMVEELGWDAARTERELADVERVFTRGRHALVELAGATR